MVTDWCKELTTGGRSTVRIEMCADEAKRLVALEKESIEDVLRGVRSAVARWIKQTAPTIHGPMSREDLLMHAIVLDAVPGDLKHIKVVMSIWEAQKLACFGSDEMIRLLNKVLDALRTML